MTTIHAIRTELAPTGMLRAGLNRSNFLLVTKGSPDDDPRGVASDLARELARRLDVAVTFLNFKSPGEMADAVKTWDVAFLGAEPPPLTSGQRFRLERVVLGLRDRARVEQLLRLRDLLGRVAL